MKNSVRKYKNVIRKLLFSQYFYFWLSGYRSPAFRFVHQSVSAFVSQMSFFQIFQKFENMFREYGSKHLSSTLNWLSPFRVTLPKSFLSENNTYYQVRDALENRLKDIVPKGWRGSRPKPKICCMWNGTWGGGQLKH